MTWYPLNPGHSGARRWADVPDEAKAEIRARYWWAEDVLALFHWEEQE